MKPQMGIAGLGRMGAAMATRLLQEGHEVLAWNRTPRALAGVTIVGTPAGLAGSVDVVLSCLFDDVAVRSVYLGHDGLLSGGNEGTLYLDTSTVAPGVSREVGEAVFRAGAAFMDAPVLGTVEPCRRGALTAMVGGDARLYERALPALKSIASSIHLMGPLGSGSAAKLAINLVMGAYWAALNDGFTLAAHYALDRARLLAIIADGPAALAQLPLKLPVLNGSEPDVGFDIDGYVKDLHAILSAVDAPGALPIAEAALRSFGTAAAAGWGKRDVASIALFGAGRGAATQS